MPKRLALVCFAFALLVGSPAAYAQEPGRVGLTMGVSGSLGLMLRASPAVAFRPYFTVLNSSTGLTSSDNADTTSFGAGVTTILYVTKRDNLRTYLAPDVNFRHIKNSGSSSIGSSGNSFSEAGLFGAEYTLGSHFGVFGEIGLRYSHSTTTQSGVVTPSSTVIGVPITIDESITSHAWQTTTGVGAILYF